MKIARMLSPVHSLGPGERVCLWTLGCSKKCKGCIADELQSASGAAVDAELLSKLIVNTAIKGGSKAITISGGDPLEQPEDLLLFLKKIRDYFDDILVYTGYTLDEINEGCAGQNGKECLKYIDVLIDGRYIEALNEKNCALRGSTNQVIHFFNEDLRPVYEEYMKKGRVLESFKHEDTVIVTGIMDREE